MAAIPPLSPHDPAATLGRRVDEPEARLAIGQLPIRHALAVDRRDLDEHPQAVGFDSWHNGPPPALPDVWPSCATFWPTS